MTFIDHFTFITDITLHYTYNKMYISSLHLWMSPLETIKQENNLGIIGNDLKNNG